MVIIREGKETGRHKKIGGNNSCLANLKVYPAA